MSRAPGVHTEYVSSQSLSLSAVGSTAVPVFIGPFESTQVKPGACIAVDSWSDFNQSFKADIVASAVVKSTTSKSQAKAGTEWAYTASAQLIAADHNESIRLFFANGGGRCYILPLFLAAPNGKKNKKSGGDAKAESEATLAELPKIISQYPDITLLVWGGANENKEQVYQALSVLISGLDSPYFLLTDIAHQKEAPALTDNPNVGVWAPHLQVTRQSKLPNNESILISGYQDDKEDEVVSTLAQLKTRNLALYTTIKQDLQSQFNVATRLTLSPTALVAGQICRIDNQQGVWWAPAGNGVVLQGIDDVTERYTEAEHQQLNDKGINAVRYFSRPTPGFRLYGARTQQVESDEYRFINVRRLSQMVVRDVGYALQKLVFSPNTATTWLAAQSAISAYLHALWVKGAITGSSAEAAFFVKVGRGVTMSNQDILNGVMNVEVGIMPSRPAEFIVLRFSQIMGEAS